MNDERTTMVISSKGKIPEVIFEGRMPEKEFERITRGAYHYRESCDTWGWIIDVFYPNDLGAELRSRESPGDGPPEWVVIPTVKGGVLGSGTIANYVMQKRYGKKLMGYPAEGPEEIKVPGLEEAAAICETIRDI